MHRAGYSAEEIAETIAYLNERRYLDDAAFARDFARARAERRRWGPARIDARLRALGLSEGHIDAALSEAFPEGELGLAERALARFLETERKNLPVDKRRARAYRHLLQRGFSPETAHELVTGHDFGDTEGLE